MYRVNWVGGKRHWRSNAALPANTGQSPDAVSILGQRQRWWTNIETALGECHVFGEVLPQSIQRYTADPVLNDC